MPASVQLDRRIAVCYSQQVRDKLDGWTLSVPPQLSADELRSKTSTYWARS